MKGHKVIRIIAWVLIGICIAGALGLVLGLAVQALWNWLAPAIFGLPAITYWQAVGLFILCHILFKSHVGIDHKKEDKKSGRHEHIRSRIHKLIGGADKADTGEGGIENAPESV